MAMVKFSPTALNFGYDFVLYQSMILGHPLCTCSLVFLICRAIYPLPKSEDNLKLVVSDVVLEGDVDIIDPVYLQEVFQLAHGFLL